MITFWLFNHYLSILIHIFSVFHHVSDELPYVLNDEEYMLRYRAELKHAVLRAKASPQSLLKGFYVCIAAHVQPPAKTLSAIVRSAGGEVCSRKLTVS